MLFCGYYTLHITLRVVNNTRFALDQDMGYGPTMDSTDAGQLMVISNDDSTHLPAPPITSTQMADATSEVVKFDSNFIMTKPGESVAVRHVRRVVQNDYGINIIMCFEGT